MHLPHVCGAGAWGQYAVSSASHFLRVPSHLPVEYAALRVLLQSKKASERGTGTPDQPPHPTPKGGGWTNLPPLSPRPTFFVKAGLRQNPSSYLRSCQTLAVMLLTGPIAAYRLLKASGLSKGAPVPLTTVVNQFRCVCVRCVCVSAVAESYSCAPNIPHSKCPPFNSRFTCARTHSPESFVSSFRSILLLLIFQTSDVILKQQVNTSP